MKIYVRKVLNHDITHEISVTRSIVKEFFDEKTSFNMIGKKSNKKGIVTINSATDPRFGGDFKQLLRAEGDVSEGDIILIYKYQNYYIVDIVTKEDYKFESIMELSKEDVRHTLLYKEESVIDIEPTENKKEKFKNWLINNKKYTDETIKNYIRYIDYIYEKGYSDINLYTTDDISIIDNLINKFKNDRKYINYNNENHGNSLSALIQYKNFISLENFIKYYNSNIDRIKSTEEVVSDELKKEFLTEYPIERFKTMKLEEYSMGLNDGTTFCRQVESGKYKDYGARCNIDPSGAAHWGIFFREKEQLFQDSDYNNLEYPQEYWEKFKNELYNYLINLNEENPKFYDSYPMLKGMTMTLQKICYMYYPNKFINFITKNKILELYDIFGLDYNYNTPTDKLSYDLNIYIRENVLNAKNEQAEYISSLLWQFKESILNKNNENLEESKVKYIDDEERITGAYNKIFYGVPGCGKSYTVAESFDEKDYHIERTTFHPEYTNSDFVGQIIPMVKENTVEYEFHPGAFTAALKYALENKEEKVCLIIEEINRGNASAIFGDIFQLLDRDELGKSRYSIFNGPIKDYLTKEGLNISKIYIPSNMWIVATMNTSDQNVFTLDTAFKRRWKMEYIKNIFADNEESTKLRNKIIQVSDKYPNVTWEKFVKKINRHITYDTSGINGEDKQLGMYFVTIDEIDNQKEFAEKILSYLWEDVAKLNKEYWFGDIKSYDELLEKYDKSYLEVFDNLFDDEIKVPENTENISITEGE